MDASLQEVVRSIVDPLVAKDYKSVERLTAAVRLDAKAIDDAIQGYGRVLCEPPPDAYNGMDIVEARRGDKPAWSIRMKLWTIEEGESDLSLEVTVKQLSDGYVIELDDIHVL